MKYFFALILFSFNSYANMELAPKDFMYGGKKAVFVDFISAEYDLQYDTKNMDTNVTTQITFIQQTSGHPLFDLKSIPLSVSVNGESTSQKLISPPGGVTVVRMINKELPAGTHTLSIQSKLTSGVRFSSKKNSSQWNNVSSAFFIRDLRDRMLLERYLPTNFEYDSYKMILNVEVTGTKRWHSLFANGNVTKLSENRYRVEYPSYYVSSSVFFHLVPINKFVRWYLTYPSIDGRNIPVTIYSSYRFYNKMLKTKAWNVMAELEKDYGPWPHDQLIIYGTGIRGGMEYAGATETSIVSLGHELQHSYFAKGIHPANGNAGWLDEAIASWRDKGHQSLERPFYSSANLGAQNSYTRKTDKRSYEYGRSFMGYLDYQLKAAGVNDGLKDYLRFLVQTRMHTSITTEIFKSELESFSGLNFDADFFQYIYGGQSQNMKTHHHSAEENPHHPIISEEELESIL